MANRCWECDNREQETIAIRSGDKSIVYMRLCPICFKILKDKISESNILTIKSSKTFLAFGDRVDKQSSDRGNDTGKAICTAPPKNEQENRKGIQGAETNKLGSKDKGTGVKSYTVSKPRTTSISKGDSGWITS